MKITLEISNIDYGEIVREYLPLIREKMAGKEGGAKLMGMLAGMPPAVAAGMIDKLPASKKDELVVMLVEKNKDAIAEKIMKYAAEKGVSFSIDDIEVEQ